MVIIIDHYDSFVFNIAHYIEELGFKVKVVRHDAITVEDIIRLSPSHLILSPGPCGPLETGVSIAIVQHFKGEIPILGICLGHQVIGHVFGAQVVQAKRPMHGQASLVKHNKKGLFAGLPNPCKVGRYHSLIVDQTGLSPDLIVTASSEEGELMAFASEKWKIAGVQFHPESILTEGGRKMLGNFFLNT